MLLLRQAGRGCVVGRRRAVSSTAAVHQYALWAQHQRHSNTAMHDTGSAAAPLAERTAIAQSPDLLSRCHTAPGQLVAKRTLSDTRERHAHDHHRHAASATAHSHSARGSSNQEAGSRGGGGGGGSQSELRRSVARLLRFPLRGNEDERLRARRAVIQRMNTVRASALHRFEKQRAKQQERLQKLRDRATTTLSSDAMPRTEKIATVPNMLSLYRILATPVIMGLLVQEQAQTAFGLFVTAAVSDWVS